VRFRSFVSWILVLVGLVASGTLECGGAQPSVAERRGQMVYRRMCIVCHASDGVGYAADQAPAIGNPYFLASVTDEFLRNAIANGRTGSTMSAWSRVHGGPLGSGEVDSLIAYVRAWSDAPKAKLDESPNLGDKARGAGVYARECARCHGPEGTSGTFMHIGNPDLLASASDGFLRYAIRNGRPGTAMPAFEATLGDGAIDDVIALLRTWQSRPSPTPRLPAPKPPPMPLGPVPLNPKGPEPVGFKTTPATTSAVLIKEQLDRGAKMALLDARAPSDYLNEHIAGAVSVPFYDPEPYFDKLPHDAWLVCYCACPHAESGSLAQKLAGKGFTKVTVLDEGLPYWKGHKFPTHSGLDP
jgi:cytochrome c oxidase cbb3-type subunit 3/ubiquinol-cytochrome c reductase cytochrome c subunit